MIQLDRLKRKALRDSYIGARIQDELKADLMEFCRINRLSTSTLITALIEDFLRTQGHLNKSQVISRSADK